MPNVGCYKWMKYKEIRNRHGPVSKTVARRWAVGFLSTVNVALAGVASVGVRGSPAPTGSSRISHRFENREPPNTGT